MTKILKLSLLIRNNIVLYLQHKELGLNIFSNYVAVIWMGGMSILLIPVYLKLLGPEQWGLVAICMAVQGFLGLLDIGLSQIMVREISRNSGNHFMESKIFRIFSRFYMSLGLLGFIFGQISVSWLVLNWFKLNIDLQIEADTVLRLVLIQFMFQFFNSASTGYWVGIQAQKLVNFRQCAFGTAKNIGAILLVFFSSADAISYVIPFAAISALEWALNHKLIIRQLGNPANVNVKIGEYKKIAYETSILAIGVLLGMLVSQIDRIILTRSIDSDVFGRYIVVANLGLAFIQLQSALFRAIGPRIMKAEAEGKSSNFRVLVIPVFFLSVLPCIVVALNAQWLLEKWVSDPQIVLDGTRPLQLILIAVAINSIFQIIYQHILSSGQFHIISIINFTNLIVAYLVLTFTVSKLGLAAGGLAWISISSIQLLFGFLWLRLRN